MPMAGMLAMRPDQIGFALTEEGNPAITAKDNGNGLLVTIEFTPESWKAFLRNAPRLRGVGIHAANRIEVAAADALHLLNGGAGDD